MIGLKREINNSTIIVRILNTRLSVTYTTARQKIYKGNTGLKREISTGPNENVQNTLSSDKRIDIFLSCTWIINQDRQYFRSQVLINFKRLKSYKVSFLITVG